MQEKQLFLKRFCAAAGCGQGPQTQAGQRFPAIASSLLSSLPSSLLKRSKRQKESGGEAVSSNRKSGPKNVKTRMNTGFHAGWAMAGRVILNPNPNLYLCMASLGAFSHGVRDEIAQTINFIFRTGGRESQTKPPVFHVSNYPRAHARGGRLGPPR